MAAWPPVCRSEEDQSKTQLPVSRRQWLAALIYVGLSFLSFSVGNFRRHLVPRRLDVLSEHEEPEPSKLRILYIITSLTEVDNGRRATTKGYDRFSNTLIPVVRESTHSMVAAGFEVDVYLIAHYSATYRYRQLRDAIPSSSGLQVWDDATPAGYDPDYSKDRIQLVTRALARQHRYVIKDKLAHYDLFCNFEDDMIIKGSQVQYFHDLTEQLAQLKQSAPLKLPVKQVPNPVVAANRFYGAMTKSQLERTIPGFMRVEVRQIKRKRRHKYRMPTDYQWNETVTDANLTASICCGVAAENVNDHIPRTASGRDLCFWETSMDVLGLRQLPNLEWAVTLAGGTDELYEDPSFVIGDYWVGKGLDVFQQRPEKTHGRYSNNQGGWMATRRQIEVWNRRWCRGGFLPPYDLPVYDSDGLVQRSVEYWSGGIQIAGVLGCNLKRIVLMDPDKFSHHLIYHASNNKQRQENIQYRFSTYSMQELWGQLNAARKRAEQALEDELANSPPANRSL